MQNFTLFGTKFNNNSDLALDLTEMVSSSSWSGDLNLPTVSTSEDTEILEDLFIDALDRGVFFKVTGNSMKDAGIFDGDIAIVEREQKAKIGDIVIASVGDKYAIRYLAQDEEGRIFLRPANKKYRPIYTDAVNVFGVVTSVFRKY